MNGIPFALPDLAAINAEVTLTLGAAVLLLWAAFDRQRAHPRRFAVATVLFLVAALAGVMIGLPAQIAAGNVQAFSGQIAVDHYGVFFSALFLVAALLCVGASMRFLDDSRAHGAEYYFFLLLALVGMMVMARANDLISMFVGLELQALSVYVLVGYLKADRRSNEASIKYFILGGLSSAILLYGLSLIYARAGTTSLPGIAAELGSGPAGAVLLVGLLLVVVSLAFKVAAVPFHVWAPDTYSGAPTPVTLFISVASKAAAFAMAMRLLYVALESLTPLWSPLIAVLALLTMTYGNIAALTQTSVKRMLAYSSIAQAGYALIGVAAGTALGVTSTMFYLLVYTFMNVGAWAILLVLRRHGVAAESVDDLAGLSQRAPWAAAAMAAFLLSLGGIPPALGFLGKWYVFAAAIDAGMVWLAVFGALNAAVSLYYYLRIAVAMYMQEANEEVTLVRSRPLEWAIAAAAAVTVLGIVWASALIQWARGAALPL